jgi:Transposase DDE domain
LSIRNLKIIDNNSIQLFSKILRGVGCNRLDGARKKGGLQVHAMMDAFSGVTEFVRLTEAREHDQKLLYHLKLAPNSWVVFDKAYNTYGQFAKWTTQQVWFVTRQRGNADFHVTKVMVDKTRQRSAKGVLKEHYVTVALKQNNVPLERLKFREYSCV